MPTSAQIPLRQPLKTNSLTPNLTDSVKSAFLDAKKRRLNPATVRKLEPVPPSKDETTTSDAHTTPQERAHIPVLLEETLSTLGLADGGLFVDATFGMGGHTRSILAVPGTRVIGIDRDSSILKKALDEDPTLKQLNQTGRLALLHGRFSNMGSLLQSCAGKVDGILMDIGVSSVQLDTAGRGFSYREELDAPLDMRMDQSDPSSTAYDLVNKLSEAKLADLIWRYGEDKRSRSIARTIVEYRATKPITTSFQLAKLISDSIPRGKSAYMSPGERIAEHSKRTFQALRIEVNQELEELKKGLAAAETLLRPGGRLVVITFHSLEDRIVKTFLAEAAGKLTESGADPSTTTATPKTFEIIVAKVARATSRELTANKRSKPAKLRAAVRTSAPARPFQL